MQFPEAHNSPIEPMRASVVITTKNRRDELSAAIASALTQSAQPEVLVIDDGSTDGTSDMVRADFPAVRLERSTKSLGLIVQRNRAARLASGEIIFSLDDDAEFSTPGVVEQTLEDFDDPRIGAVAIPHVDMLTGHGVNQSRETGRSSLVRFKLHRHSPRAATGLVSAPRRLP